MGTPLSRIFNKFLGEIDDKEWLQVDDDIIEDLMFDYLENATVDFVQCRKELIILPPESGEVEYSMDGLTSTIKFTPVDSRKPSIRIVGSLTGAEYFQNEDFTIEGETIKFNLIPTEDLILTWSAEGEFTEELNLTEIRILALAMLLHYLKPKIMTQDTLKQYVSDKDFSKLSGANMLLRLIGLKKNIEKELDVMQARYAFQNFEGFN